MVALAPQCEALRAPVIHILTLTLTLISVKPFGPVIYISIMCFLKHVKRIGPRHVGDGFNIGVFVHNACSSAACTTSGLCS